MTEKLNSHLPLDVVLQQVLIDSVKVIAAHVVVIVGHRVAELLSVGSVFHIVGLVAVVIVVVALKGEKQSVRQKPCSVACIHYSCERQCTGTADAFCVVNLLSYQCSHRFILYYSFLAKSANQQIKILPLAINKQQI